VSAPAVDEEAPARLHAMRPSPTSWSRLIGPPLSREGDWPGAGEGGHVSVSLIVSRPLRVRRAHFVPLQLQDVRRMRVSGFPKHLLFYRFDDEEVFSYSFRRSWRTRLGASFFLAKELSLSSTAYSLAVNALAMTTRPILEPLLDAEGPPRGFDI